MAGRGPNSGRDPATLSHKPSQMRIRIRRKAGRADAEIEHYCRVVYNKPVEEWDWEELAKGRPRNAQGKFQGAPPKWITPHLLREARRRLVEGVYGELGVQSKYALETLNRLLTDGEVDDKVALDAAKFVINHIIGNPKAIVSIDASDEVKQFLAPLELRLCGPDELSGWNESQPPQ